MLLKIKDRLQISISMVLHICIGTDDHDGSGRLLLLLGRMATDAPSFDMSGG